MGLISQPILDPLVGSKIGRYVIQARVGEGGMGVVYRAEQTPLGRPVALKVIHSALASDDKVVKRFLREAKIACQLTNPHTVTIFDFGNEDGVLYLAMELLQGESLHERLCRGTVEPVRAAEITAQVCRSLMEAHKKGIIHRDLKPDNIFLGTADDGALLAKVLDYGLARLVSNDDSPLGVQATLTQIGTIVGTPIYMSPEQARGRKLDARTDLYSMGIVLFEMLTGVAPFMDEDAVVVLGKHIKDKVPRIAETGARVAPPAALQVLVDKLLEKEPSKRPPDAAWVFQELRAYLASATTGGPLPSVMDETSSPGLTLRDPVPPRPVAPDAESGVQPRLELPVVDEWEDTAAGAPGRASGGPLHDLKQPSGRTPLPPLESEPTLQIASDPAMVAEVDSRAITVFPEPAEPPTLDGETRPLETSELPTTALSTETGTATPPVPVAQAGVSLLYSGTAVRRPGIPPLALVVGGVVLLGIVVGIVILSMGGDEPVIAATALPTTAGAPSAGRPAADAQPRPGAGLAKVPATPGDPAPTPPPNGPTAAPADPSPAPEPPPPPGMSARPPVDGRWTGTFSSTRGTLQLVQRGDTVTGTFGTDGHLSGTADGAVLRFEWSERGQQGHGVLRSYHSRRGRVVLRGSTGEGRQEEGEAWDGMLSPPPRAPRKIRPVKRGTGLQYGNDEIFGAGRRPRPRTNR